jgi:large subunit ribosomal protein L3
MVHARFGPPVIMGGVSTFAQQPQSVLKSEPMPRGEWSPGIRRTGLVARKIGIYPMWLKNGDRILTTLLQVPVSLSYEM